MSQRVLFGLAAAGVALALAAAWLSSGKSRAQAPVFQPASNPYADGIFANGIVESAQAQGSNINLYPMVAGAAQAVLVHEGDTVRAGAPLLRIDDAVQRAATDQQQAQYDAAAAQLAQLRAQPRPETLAVLGAQVALAGANVKTARDQYDKQRRIADVDARAISQEALDNAANALAAARAGEEVARRQYALARAGAWRYDLASAQRQADAARQGWRSASALLDQYTLRAPADGVVLAVNATPGSYVSPQGVYDANTQAALPVLVMGASQAVLGVRCYVDEILIGRIAAPERIVAQMVVRGSGARVPLEFVRVQPYVSPKVALSNARQERVDLRVLPLVFRFRNQPGLHVYPGQLVDVYVGRR